MTTRATSYAARVVALAVTVCLPTAATVDGAQGNDERAEAHAEEGTDHSMIVGVGGAAELELGDRTLHPGMNVMVEWDAIESWLEFEVGASVLSAPGGVAVPSDLLVKKPFRLARWAVVMVGAGPEVVQVTGTNRGTYVGGAAALDFMFRPWGRHVGLWIEPEYDLTYQHGASSGIGTTGGVLFGW